MDRPARVVLVDDHEPVRMGLKELLNAYGGFEVIGEASGGNEAVAETLRLKPDLVIMDIGLPDMDGITATQLIHSESPSTRIVMLTSHSDQERILGALEAGAVGYILKDADPHQMMLRLRAAAESSSETPA